MSKGFRIDTGKPTEEDLSPRGRRSLFEDAKAAAWEHPNDTITLEDLYLSTNTVSSLRRDFAKDTSRPIELVHPDGGFTVQQAKLAVGHLQVDVSPEDPEYPKLLQKAKEEHFIGTQDAESLGETRSIRAYEVKIWVEPLQDSKDGAAITGSVTYDESAAPEGSGGLVAVPNAGKKAKAKAPANPANEPVTGPPNPAA